VTPRLFKSREGFANWVAAHPARALNFQPIHITLLHDDWCAFPDCNCRPWIHVEIATPGNVTEGARQERAWRKSRAA
jgi:hypothetical protein